MKKNNITGSPENSEAVKLETLISKKKLKQGSTDTSFPQEYEEQRSMNLRMKPQPLVKPKKAGVKR